MFRPEQVLLFLLLTCTTLSLPVDKQQPRPSDRKVLLLLFDGFRWDFLDMPGLRGFQRMQRLGVRADYLLPEFPTNTMPNHYSIDTGLHVESHGVINNKIYDEKTGKKFSFQGTHFLDPMWWNGAEPFWITAKKQGIRTHLFHWIGCSVEIRGVRPNHCGPYPNSFADLKLTTTALEEALLLMEKDQTDLVGIYNEDVDHNGHRKGVYARETNQSIYDLDHLIDHLMDELETRNMTSLVDVILVSDHGLTNTASENVIYISDYFSFWQWQWKFSSMVTTSSTCAAIFLWPKEEQIMEVYGLVKDKHPHLHVYLKEHYNDIPNWHLAKNDRTAPILLLADPGWCILRPYEEFAFAFYNFMDGPANHGYNNNEPDMRAIFMAFGPDFKNNYRTGPINMVDVYQMVCRLAGIKEQPNNGTWSHVNHMLTRDDDTK